MKILKYFLYFLLVLVLVIAGGLLYISSTYGELVEGLVHDALDEYLESKVEIGSVSTGRFEDLPYFSMVLNDVVIMEPEDFSENPDTLISADRVSLQFNIWDVYNGNFELKKVEIEDGKGRFLVNKKGKANYIFWKVPEEESSDTSEFRFGLKEVSLERIDYSYNDESIDLVTHTKAQHAELTGNFTSQDLRLVFNGTFNKTLVQVDKIKYVHYRNLKINSGIEINHETDAINFLKGEIKVDDQFTLEQSGYILKNDYKFTLSANHIKLMQLYSLVPPSFSKFKENYSGLGKVTFNAEVTSKGSKGVPYINAELALNQGTLTHKKSNTQLSNVSLVAAFNNGKRRTNSSSSLTVKNIQADFPSGALSGSIVIRDFNVFDLALDVNGEMDLGELGVFMGLDRLQNLRGSCAFDLTGKLLLSSLMAEPVVAEGSWINGDMSFDSLGFRHSEIPLVVSELSGKAKFPGRNMLLQDVTGRVQSSNIKLNGRISNLMYWVFNTRSKTEKPIKIYADLELDKLNVEEFIWHSTEEEEKREKISVAEFILKASIKDFKLRKFEAANIRTNWYLAANSFIMDPLSMDALGGKVKGKLKLGPRGPDKFDLQLHGGATSIEMDQLFYAFNDFGQKEITSSHLKGTATTTIDVKGLMNRQGYFEPKTVVAQAEVRVEDGKLMNYSTLKAISDYFNKNILYKGLFRAKALEKNLMDVNFDVLENQIIIKDEQMIIPRMQIGNSVVGVFADGTYDFNDSMDFHLDFDISELLLTSKKGSGKHENAEMSEKGGIRVFLHIYGTSENLIIEQDKERKRAYKHRYQKEEKTELKTALNEEFGWFKGDTTLYEKDPQEADFDLIWEEDTASSKPKSKRDSVSVKKKKLIKKPVETEEEFDFGDDDF